MIQRCAQSYNIIFGEVCVNIGVTFAQLCKFRWYWRKRCFYTGFPFPTKQKRIGYR